MCTFVTLAEKRRNTQFMCLCDIKLKSKTIKIWGEGCICDIELGWRPRLKCVNRLIRDDYCEEGIGIKSCQKSQLNCANTCKLFIPPSHLQIVQDCS